MTGKSKDGATPSKVRKEQEPGGSEATASTRPSEADLQSSRFKLYKKDYREVKEVCAKILGLPDGKEVTQEDIDSSPVFQLRQAIDETSTPEIIGEHWINFFKQEG